MANNVEFCAFCGELCKFHEMGEILGYNGIKAWYRHGTGGSRHQEEGENIHDKQRFQTQEESREIFYFSGIGSRDLADLAAHATGELQEAVRCIRESARKYENVELELELTRPGEGSGAVWLAAAAAKLLAQVPTHEEWACREQAAIDRHIADGKRRVRELTEQLSGLPRSRRRV